MYEKLESKLFSVTLSIEESINVFLVVMKAGSNWCQLQKK